MKIVKKYATKSDCYQINAKIKVKGLMLHSVGCNQPKASVFANIWNKPNVGACVHAVIDAIDGTVIQCLPWEHRGWHGGGSSNNTHIGVEMGEPACVKYTSGSNFTVSDLKTAQKCVVTAYNSAVELFAYLCEKYDLNPLSDGVIVSHSEGYRRGIATNHGDPEHLWKGLKLKYTMGGFRKDVAKKMGKPNKPNKPNKKEFVVRVDISNLNIRAGAGLSYKVNGTCPKGSYTIVETKTNGGYEWGKLKSGAGWIALKYTTKL